MGNIPGTDRGESVRRGGTRARSRGKRPARNDLRVLRCLRANRGIALVLVERCARAAARRIVRAARKAHPGATDGEIPRILHQRRGSRAQPVGPEHFGPGKAPGHPNGFNHEFYAKVFETMLRLKANYLWPAMWGRAFAEDDPRNHETAAKYGIVMGTAHNEPMLRGIEEWNRHAVPAERDEQGNIVEQGHDPYGGNGGVELPAESRRDRGVLDRGHPPDGAARYRGRGHARDARKRGLRARRW
nr:glycosyl hydrolase 115 family protein [Actinopolyspora halophila]